MDLFKRTQGRGAKLIYVDPIFTNTAAKADVWLAIKPGTDLAFVLALTYVVLEEKLYNLSYVKDHFQDFEVYQKHILEHHYTPEWAEKITGIHAKQIRTIARDFMRYAPKAIYGGVPERSDTALHVLSSKSFWIGEVLLGMAIPFFIILYSKAKAIKATIYASISGMVGIFFMRYNLVHDTLVYPMQTMKIKEYQLAPTWVEYTPTVTEWAIALGSMGICLALYYIGENFFFLDPNKEDEYFKHYVDKE